MNDKSELPDAERCTAGVEWNDANTARRMDADGHATDDGRCKRRAIHTGLMLCTQHYRKHAAEIIANRSHPGPR